MIIGINGINYGYPLIHVYSLRLKIAIEIACFPIKSGGSFHSFVNVYQRVSYLYQVDVYSVFQKSRRYFLMNSCHADFGVVFDHPERVV